MGSRVSMLTLLTAALSLCANCSAQQPRVTATGPDREDRTSARDLLYAPPSPDTIPGDRRGEQIRLGYEIVVRTQDYGRPYVGNGLACTNCHLDGGLNPNAAPFVGVANLYPEFRARAGRVVTLADRINECVERSLNGKPLPPDSSKLRAIVAYITWLSEGLPERSAIPWRGLAPLERTRVPDKANGQRLFASKCAFCHGADGAGTMSAPPVWGPKSFNIGSEMARLSVLASYVKANMPRAWGWSLSDNEAYDVAAFVSAQPRPDFSGKSADWPQGGKPDDVPY
ncbi:MAG TPA: c-type cytochrome [Nitrospira sp.]|nr:c-type cytochrome [Nitrospira sp.]